MLQSDPYTDYENDIETLDNSLSHYDYPNTNQKLKPRVAAQKEKSGNPVCTRLYLSSKTFYNQHWFLKKKLEYKIHFRKRRYGRWRK